MSTRALVLIVVAASTLPACSSARHAAELVIQHGRDGAFYVVPSPLPSGPPGALIRSQQLFGAPDGSVAWRVLYHTRDAFGRDIAASAVVVAPTRPAPPGGNVIVSWGHPTTGSAVQCAPSLGVDPFVVTEGLRDLLRDGYVVAATDYPGMGAPGPSSYLVGTSEGNSVLDTARAARAIPGSARGEPIAAVGPLARWSRGHVRGAERARVRTRPAPRRGRGRGTRRRAGRAAEGRHRRRFRRNPRRLRVRCLPTDLRLRSAARATDLGPDPGRCSRDATDGEAVPVRVQRATPPHRDAVGRSLPRPRPRDGRALEDMARRRTRPGRGRCQYRSSSRKARPTPWYTRRARRRSSPGSASKAIGSATTPSQRPATRSSHSAPSPLYARGSPTFSRARPSPRTARRRPRASW